MTQALEVEPRRTGRGSTERQCHQPTVCCAIYTRKSTDEGLDRDFSSLDAQREAGEAYILSQRSEGWVALPDRYDDGGFTGANMDRPALLRLLADARAGRIDCIVVYKVDRLSRSLLDFARIMGVFEAHGVSFVSVTQQFNTATSMGRLVLNVLLSFAQFEREMIAERTRDKIVAARRRGKWTGGVPVLGYDVAPEGGRLVVNEEEAARAREIFQLYLKRRSLLSVVSELDRRGWHTKRRACKNGNARGGKPFTKTAVSFLLKNPLYAGNVRCGDAVYPGEHQAIIDERTWRRVQRLLKRHGRSCGERRANGHDPLLKGLLYCDPCGVAMTQSVTKRNGKSYRYYVCLNAQKRGWATCPTKSVPADKIEALVAERLVGLCLIEEEEPPASLEDLLTAWQALKQRQRRRAVLRAIERLDYDGNSGSLKAMLIASGIEQLRATLGLSDREEEQ